MKLLPQDLTQHPVINDVGETIQHVFDSDMIHAVNAALTINRPLLVWGEPGIGKSQLARAAAQALNRVFIPFVADAHTESHDLLWQFDAVARLAEAQIQSAENHDRATLAMDRFIVPGPLWWAFDWGKANDLISQASDENQICHRKAPSIQAGCAVENGAVVLIDEIDKAGSDVPNGLLEALGASRFHPQGIDEAVKCNGVSPLIIITTNEERSLPDAFQRRCLSLHLKFPKAEKQQQAFLASRAKVSFPKLDEKKYKELDNQSILEAAAELLKKDREYALQHRLYPLPGQAEYFDLLRGIQRLSKETKQDPVELMQQLRTYVYQKNPGFHRSQD